VPSLQEHLDAPQFTDASGEPLPESLFARVGGNWVAAGVPRRRGYLFYGICLLGGIFLILTSQADFDIFALFGFLSVGLGVAGGIETALGRSIASFFDRGPG
jgi:hypothetical protein